MTLVLTGAAVPSIAVGVRDFDEIAMAAYPMLTETLFRL
jgi:hypothetical protein